MIDPLSAEWLAFLSTQWDQTEEKPVTPVFALELIQFLDPFSAHRWLLKKIFLVKLNILWMLLEIRFVTSFKDLESEIGRLASVDFSRSAILTR